MEHMVPLGTYVHFYAAGTAVQERKRGVRRERTS